MMEETRIELYQRDFRHIRCQLRIQALNPCGSGLAATPKAMAAPWPLWWRRGREVRWQRPRYLLERQGRSRDRTFLQAADVACHLCGAVGDLHLQRVQSGASLGSARISGFSPR